MSPRVKTRVTAIKNPRRAFGPTDHMMALGRVRDASSISSAISQRRVSKEYLAMKKELDAAHTYVPNSHTQ